MCCFVLRVCAFSAREAMSATCSKFRAMWFEEEPAFLGLELHQIIVYAYFFVFVFIVFRYSRLVDIMSPGPTRLRI